MDSLDSMWTGGGLEVDFMDYIETRGRLQEDPWGSVRYRFLLSFSPLSRPGGLDRKSGFVCVEPGLWRSLE